MKRFLSLALCVAMIATAIFSVSAVTAAEVANGTCGSNLTWTLDDAGTLTISGTGYMYHYSITDETEGVDESAPWISYASSIKKVVIDTGVISIGENAFEGCTALESVVFTAAYHPYVPVTEFAENTAYKLMSTNLYGTIFANTVSGSLKTTHSAPNSRDFYIESATTLDGAPAYRFYYYYNDVKCYFYLSSNKTTTLKYTETVPLYEQITDETTGEVTQGAEISTVWVYDETNDAWLSPAWKNRYLGSDATNKREDIRCYAYTNISDYCIAHFAVKDTTKTEVDGLSAIYDSAFADCTALQNIYCKSSEEAWASTAVYAGNDVLANAAVTYNYVEDDNEGGDDVVTAPEAITLVENSKYAVDETQGMILAKMASARGESLETFVSNLATDAAFYQVVDKTGAVVTSVTRMTRDYSVQLLDADGNVIKTYTIVMVGDADGNGRIMGSDVSAVKVWVKDRIRTPYECAVSDLDGNGRIMGNDVSALSAAVKNGF